MRFEINEKTRFRCFNKHWQFCVGSAHAAYALRRDWTEQLRQVHKELGIERVRFHGIFCDDMQTVTSFSDIIPVPFTKKYKERSFRRCAAAYDNILSAGMKPFVELSFMPKALSSLPHTRGLFFYKPNVAMPKSLDKWAEYVKSFVEFLIDRYGRREVEQWYFEVWNEPDLPVVFFDGGMKSYFRLYEATVWAIKAADENIRVGGPATSGSKWTKEFLDFCRENGVPADFVSTHQYAGDPIGGVTAKNEYESENELSPVSIDFFSLFRKENKDRSLLEIYRNFMASDKAPRTLKRNTFIRSAENVREITRGLPLFYTEWNMCAGFSAPCNDTAMQAAYILHAVFGTQGSIDGSSIWSFSDLFEEFHQFPEEFHGGFGLLTQSGIKKPSYHALEILGDSGDLISVLPSENEKLDCAVISDDEDGVITFAVSYLDFQPCGKTEALEFCAVLERKPYSVRLCRIDEEHCNPLKIWQEAGSVQMPNPALCREIAEKSAPVWESEEYEYKDGKLSVKAEMTENSVCFIRIKI